MAVENTKTRKLLIKQKILIGGYVLNTLNKKPLNEQIILLEKIKNTIDEKRKSDLFAINNLMEQINKN
jgi:hypothetical protein